MTFPTTRRCSCGQRDRDGAPVGCYHEDVDDERGVPLAPPITPPCPATFDGCSCYGRVGHDGPHRSVRVGHGVIEWTEAVAS